MTRKGLIPLAEREFKGTNIVDFPPVYISIDVETTDLSFEYGEIIEVSALLIENGSVSGKYTSLVRPPLETSADLDGTEASHYISEFIEELTGITNEMLATAPGPKDVMPQLAQFIGDHTLVGHNVNFDVNFLYDAFQNCGLILRNDFIDTMRLSRKLLPELAHHRLGDLVSHFGIEQETSHRAESDALATMACFEAIKKAVLSTRTVEEFRAEFKKNSSNYKNSLQSIVPTTDEFDETNPVFGKVVVFTGTLSSMGRRDAFQLVADLGGYPEDKITKRTNFLVVGNEDFAKSVKDGRTNKMKKADEYQRKGQDIVVLSENTFFEVLENT